MTLFIVISVLFFHWLADFIAQTDAQAKAKSKDFYALAIHCLTYSLIMSLGSWSCFWVRDLDEAIVFFFIVFWSHLLIDAITSRINSWLYKNGQIHEMFVSIGFDQFLHFCVVFGMLSLSK